MIVKETERISVDLTNGIVTTRILTKDLTETESCKLKKDLEIDIPADVNFLVVDVESVSYMSSSGVGAILWFLTHNDALKKCTIINASPRIRGLLKLLFTNLYSGIVK